MLFALSIKPYKLKPNIKTSLGMVYFLCLSISILGFDKEQNTKESQAITRLSIIQEAEKYLGKNYKSKIQGQIMDCSGYTRFIMSKHDIKITRSSVTQVHDGMRIKNIKEALPGDILVFKGRNVRNNRPGHVGIVHHWSNDTLYFIHSSVQKGITIDHMYNNYYKQRFLQARDVLSKK
ncbi:MAG: NlpC/P60 family protein [Saprospiraceae bacterium]